ncbi:MAG: hypothetical protein GX630_03940, partial [Actinobacteria bacterium]|nr:hypothetical protein [Actinomycetota bacterium]
MIRASYKTALVFLVAVAMLLTWVSVVDATPWADVDESLVGSYGVTMEQLGAVSSGYPDGDWRPWLSITRGQFAKMAVTGFGVEMVYPETATFTDVPDTNQFFVYVESANVATLMQGVGGGVFGVASPVTREQAIAVVARQAAADQGYDLATMTTEEIDAILAAFSDGALVSPSLRAEMAFAVKQG